MQCGTTKDTNEEFPDTLDDWDATVIEPFDQFIHRVYRRFSFFDMILSLTDAVCSAPEVCTQIALRSSSVAASSRVGTPSAIPDSCAGTPRFVNDTKFKTLPPDPSHSKASTSKVTTNTAQSLLAHKQTSKSKSKSKVDVVTSATPNPYMTLRNSNIARNREFLAQLNLQLGTQTPPLPAKEKISCVRPVYVPEGERCRGHSSEQNLTG
jgi:hypothetical protein